MSPAKKSINLCMLMTKIAVRFKLDGACMLHRKYAASRGTDSIKLGTMEPNRVQLHASLCLARYIETGGRGEADGMTWIHYHQCGVASIPHAYQRKNKN